MRYLRRYGVSIAKGAVPKSLRQTLLECIVVVPTEGYLELSTLSRVVPIDEPSLKRERWRDTFTFPNNPFHLERLVVIE